VAIAAMTASRAVWDRAAGSRRSSGIAIRVSVVPTSSDSNTPRVAGWGQINLTRPDGTLRQGKSAAVDSADAADLDPVADLRTG